MSGQCLRAVDLDDQDGDGGTVPMPPGEGVCQPVLEEGSAGQSGEGVVE